MGHTGYRGQSGNHNDNGVADLVGIGDAPCTIGYEGGDDCFGTSSGPVEPPASAALRRAPSLTGAAERTVERPRRLDFSDLDLPECLLIKPIRLWLHGPENWNLVGMQYSAHFGPAWATEALMALRGVIEILNSGGRRTMAFHKAWSRKATGDERALVALAAAVQAGDQNRAQAMALRLVGASWQQPLLDDLASLTKAFTAKGHRFVHLPPRGQAWAAAVKDSGEGLRRSAPAIRP